MKPLRPQWRGLVAKLTLFYVLLSLPCLVLVETGLLTFEFNRLMAGVDSGSLTAAAENAAQELARDWQQQSAAPRDLSTWTDAWMLRLQHPRGGLLEHESYILLELSAEPLAVAVLDPNGQVLAQAPAAADWTLQWPAGTIHAWLAAQSTHAPKPLALSDSPYRSRLALAPVRAGDGRVRGYVAVEMRLPVPWHRVLFDASLEWPIVLGYLIVFGIASSLFLAAWVTRRLNRVARAATAWSRGDFSDRIADTSRDELGRLSRLLDGMALELKDLLHSRALLAALAERARLARDLHDTVKQKAFALNLQLAATRRVLEGHAAGARIAQAEALCTQMQQELAQILDELRGESDTPFGERLRERALAWAQSSGIALELDIDAAPPLPAAQADALLRIADEALGNVLRHSGASRVHLSVRRQGSQLTLEIVDNGGGGTARAPPGMGLRNMRERAQWLPHGMFEISDSAEAGTRVAVRFDCAQEQTR